MLTTKIARRINARPFLKRQIRELCNLYKTHAFHAEMLTLTLLVALEFESTNLRSGVFNV